jgi:hypothetical protein
VVETSALAAAGDPADAVRTDDTPAPVDDAETDAGADTVAPAPVDPPDGTATAQPPVTDAEAPALAHRPRILDALADEVGKRGLVGEERTAQVLYLVLTSRLLGKQVSAGVKGHSASGKSYTVDTVLSFFPRSAYIPMTAMSERALIYSPEEYAHRTLVMFEVVAMREGVQDDMTSYLVRSLLSEGRIEYPVTVRDPDGGFTTKTIVKEGPTNLIFTTTKTHVHAENETRVLSLNTNDTREQTARVFAEIANEDRRQDTPTEWLALQSWLVKHGEKRVTIPFAGDLARLIPPVAVRMRRDFGALLALVRTHAVLHQASRDRDDEGRVVAVVDDYAAVRSLVGHVITEGVGATVPDTVRETVAAVAALAKPDGVMARTVGEELGLDKSNVSRRLRMAAEGGYVRNLEDRPGKPGRWEVGDPLPENIDLLPDPDDLPNTGGCAVAPGSEGVGREDGRAAPDEAGCAVAPVSEASARPSEPRRAAPPPAARPNRLPDPPDMDTVLARLEDVLGPVTVVPPDPSAAAVEGDTSGPCIGGCGRRIPVRYGPGCTDPLCPPCRERVSAGATK